MVGHTLDQRIPWAGAWQRTGGFPMQNITGYRGFGLFIDLNIDRFLIPCALVAALYVGAFIASL